MAVSQPLMEEGLTAALHRLDRHFGEVASVVGRHEVDDGWEPVPDSGNCSAAELAISGVCRPELPFFVKKSKIVNDYGVRQADLIEVLKQDKKWAAELERIMRE
jgi:hypothetical protein